MGGGGKGTKAKGSSKGKGNGRAAGEGRRVWRPKGQGKPSGEGYVPTGQRPRRTSLFSTMSFGELNLEALGGHQVNLNTGSQLLGDIECLLFEPVGRRVSHSAFQSAGLVICIHGMPPSRGVLEEWGNIAQRTGLVAMGVTLAVPNVQMSSALQEEDLVAVIDTICKKCDASSALMIGKGWGGPQVINLALNHREKVSGVILASPPAPAPAMTGELDVPALLLWARDDEVVAFEDAEIYLEALDNRSAPTTFTISDTGGHQCDRIIIDYEASEAFKHFVASVLLLADLEKTEREAADGSQKRLSENSRRLSAVLPEFLKQKDDGADAAKQLQKAVPHWIQSGLLTSAE